MRGPSSPLATNARNRGGGAAPARDLPPPPPRRLSLPRPASLGLAILAILDLAILDLAILALAILDLAILDLAILDLAILDLAILDLAILECPPRSPHPERLAPASGCLRFHHIKRATCAAKPGSRANLAP